MNITHTQTHTHTHTHTHTYTHTPHTPNTTHTPHKHTPHTYYTHTDQSTTGSRGVRISGSNAGYNIFRGSVKGTGYPLHSPVSPSFPLPCVTVCHHISTGVYKPQISYGSYLNLFQCPLICT